MARLPRVTAAGKPKGDCEVCSARTVTKTYA
jgi:hypothetical protein